MRSSRHKQRFDSNILGIAIVEADQVFSEANDAFLRMVGYDRHLLIAVDLSILKATQTTEISAPARSAAAESAGEAPVRGGRL